MGQPSVSVSTRIAAPTQRVWEIVSDIAVMPRFSDELQSVAFLDGDEARLGAKFTGTNFHPAIGTWTTQSCVIEFDPPLAFAWAVGDPNVPVATWRFDLARERDATRVSYTASIGPGRSGVTMLIAREPHRRAEIMADRLRQFRDGMAATLDGIKALAETTEPSSGVDGGPRHR